MKNFTLSILKRDEQLMFCVHEENMECLFPARFIEMNRPAMSMREALKDSLNHPMRVVNFVSVDEKEYSILSYVDLANGFVAVGVYVFNTEKFYVVKGTVDGCEGVSERSDNKCLSTVCEVIEEYLLETI